MSVIGETYVRVRPDFSGFKQESVRELDRALAPTRASRVTVDRSQFRPVLTDIRSLRREAEQLSQRLRGDVGGSLDRVGAVGSRSLGTVAFRASAAGFALSLAAQKARALSEDLVGVDARATAAGRELTGVAGALASANERVRATIERDLDGISKLLGFDRERVRLAERLASESERNAAAVQAAIDANRAAFGPEFGLRGGVEQDRTSQEDPSARRRRPVPLPLRLNIAGILAASTEPLFDDLRNAREKLAAINARIARQRLSGPRLGAQLEEQAQEQANINRLENQIAEQRAQDAATAAATARAERARVAAAAQAARQAAEERLRTAISNRESRLRIDVREAELTQRVARDDRAALRRLLRFQNEQSRNRKLTEAERLAFRDDAITTRGALAALTKPADRPDLGQLRELRLANAEARAALTKGLGDNRAAIQASIAYWRSQVAGLKGIERAEAEAQLIAARGRLAGLNADRPEAKTDRTTVFDLLRSTAERFTGGNLIGQDQPFAGPTGFTADLVQFLRRSSPAGGLAGAGKTSIEVNDDRIVRGLTAIERAVLGTAPAPPTAPSSIGSSSGALERNDLRFWQAQQARTAAEAGLSTAGGGI